VADQQALARVRLWWNTLDASTQMMFDKLYRTDPANVLAVISDGSLSDIDGAATLDEALTYATGQIPEGEAGPFSDREALPVIYVKDGLVVVEPVAPGAGEGVTVRWTEYNDGAASTGHFSTVAWLVDSQWVDPVQEVVSGPMANGEEAVRTVSLPGVPAGTHQVYVTSNADGNVTGSGAVPAAGTGMMAAAQVIVGGGASRPDSPSAANVQGITDALQYLSQAAQAVNDPSSVTQAAQGLYAFAGSLDTGGEAREEGRFLSIVQDDQASINVVRRAQALEALDLRDYAQGQNAWSDELNAAVQAVGTASADPWGGGQAAYEAVMGIGSGSFGLR
jgi:hypothetical protein